eukprot:CAMPEP_0202966662 /NCGR_PEP_ID=MMETSP1396-20130829/11204_1 /ASSEMBLY_ACC=CAM_ASM_000872 /TAXON_ID= /ORGANISM="Pseudokeronopsis sp., Strain Brazil" /LENGTH=232 /DNA_ID=CAMNT_0049690823 /DNA_START=69 /DNA_END=767 /DNA_ORIENTATION=+
MDKGMTRVALMSAWNRPQTEVISNEVVASFVEAAPDRFAGLCSVDLADPVQACKDLEYWVREKGFKGLRVVPWLWDKPPNANLYYPLFVKCIELDVPFCTQVGHTGPLRGSEVGRPIPYLDEVALTFPKLKIVGGHVGFPWTNEMIGLAWKYDNVYIDTSAYTPKAYPMELVQFMGTLGADKVLFGTNFPMITWEKCHKQLGDLGLSPKVLDKFTHLNAEKVFKLNPQPPKL